MAEETYKSEEDYQKSKLTRAEQAEKWSRRLTSADRTYSTWANRFRIDLLYSYYEGYQHQADFDENNRPYVINMIYSTIETKLPGLIFNAPQYSLKPRPIGLEFDFEKELPKVQLKEDALNFVCSREEFGITDKHELAILDAFFGFGVIETDYSKESIINPYLSKDHANPLDKLYCKHIPFDQFRVAANANWDLSMGKWWGYYEFVPYESMEKYAKKGLRIEPRSYSDKDLASNMEQSSGQIVLSSDSNQIIAPTGHCKVFHFWDFEDYKRVDFAPDDAQMGDRILEIRDFDYCPLATIRFGKRRRGWYPLPPVFNWISPQEEINDIREAHRVHRKRFARKYTVNTSRIENSEEIDKFIYGPDGAVLRVIADNAITPVQDMVQDPANQQSLIVSYDDMNRITGTSSEARGVSDRTTASQAVIMDRRSQVRDSKDLTRVGNFLINVGRNILRALSKADEPFWALTKLDNESLLSAVQVNNKSWKQLPPDLFKGENYDITVAVSSVSPVYAQEDKRIFMEFLALITQYEILSFSPALLREAAYRVGYKNEAVLKQFQELATIAAIGRNMQAKQSIASSMPPGVPNGPEGAAPGQLAQQQMDVSTPPDNQEIMNVIFNKMGVQQPS